MLMLSADSGGGSGAGSSGMSGSSGAMTGVPGSGMSGDHAGMTMPLLPTWLVTVWIVALALVVALHLWHVWSMTGRPRLWHVSHVVMAGGMIAMYAVPQQGHEVVYDVGVVVFGALALVMIGVGARWWRQERVLNWLWAASAMDMLVMAYMTLPAAERDVVLTTVALAYLGVEIVIWLSDPVPRLRSLLHRRALAPTGPPPTSGVVAERAGEPSVDAGPAVAAAEDRSVEAAECETVRLAADVTIAVRVTLAVMSASMVWMLLAMSTMAPMTMPLP